MPNKVWQMQDDFNFFSWVGHAISIGSIGAVFIGILPPLAASCALLWYLLQFYESRTVQLYLHGRRLRKIAALKKEMARLEAKEVVAGAARAVAEHLKHHKD